jgi:hypothetical protein
VVGSPHNVGRSWRVPLRQRTTFLRAWR